MTHTSFSLDTSIKMFLLFLFPMFSFPMSRHLREYEEMMFHHSNKPSTLAHIPSLFAVPSHDPFLETVYICPLVARAGRRRPVGRAVRFGLCVPHKDLHYPRDNFINACSDNITINRYDLLHFLYIKALKCARC